MGPVAAQLVHWHSLSQSHASRFGSFGVASAKAHRRHVKDVALAAFAGLESLYTVLAEDSYDKKDTWIEAFDVHELRFQSNTPPEVDV